MAQLNDFGTSQILDVQGFTTKAMRNMRYTAPELLPIEEDLEYPRPTKKSDVFSLAMLLLVVRSFSCSPCYRHTPNTLHGLVL